MIQIFKSAQFHNMHFLGTFSKLCRHKAWYVSSHCLRKHISRVELQPALWYDMPASWTVGYLRTQPEATIHIQPLWILFSQQEKQGSSDLHCAWLQRGRVPGAFWRATQQAPRQARRSGGFYLACRLASLVPADSFTGAVATAWETGRACLSDRCRVSHEQPPHWQCCLLFTWTRCNKTKADCAKGFGGEQN